ncbi:MAG: transketolase family protein, partial [Asgard group archaeon]|nr:transketolase family protein [Asgard group archaeon]
KYFQFGKANYVRGGGTVDYITLFSTGCILWEVIKVADEIEKQTGLKSRIINFHTLKPIDEEIIISCAEETSCLFSIEDHTVVGGLGSIISEVLTDRCPTGLTRIGLNDVFPESGAPEDLYRKYGLSVEKITETILKEI